jgi:hypothetical protein
MTKRWSTNNSVKFLTHGMDEWLIMIPRPACVVLIDSLPLQIDSVKNVVFSISGKDIQRRV